MNASHAPPAAVPHLSRRAESLGTENAFVVLAEVNELARRARTSSRSASASRISRRPATSRTRHPRRSARAGTAIRRRRGSTSCARRPHAISRRAARLDIRPDDVVVGRRRQAVHRLRDRFGDRLRRRRRGDLPGSRVSDLRVADPRERRGAGADLPARGARFRVRPGRARSEDHAEDPAADPELAAQSRPAACCRRRTSARSPRSSSRHPQIWVFADEIYSRLVYDGRFDTIAKSRGRCRSARSSATARRRPGR